MRPVYVYSPDLGRKVYVGSRPTLKEARALFREKSDDMTTPGQAFKTRTCRAYADRWLDVKHGPGTKRPAESTLSLNRSMLKPFLKDFGDQPLKGIRRREALDWALGHPRSATTVSAMFNDAVNDELLEANPFRNRQHPQSPGRRHISPLTEAEIDKLCELAVRIWKDYGKVARAWIMWSAWVGSRPGETFTRRWEDLDWERGLVRVTRIKGRKQTEWIVFPQRVQDAVLSMGTLHSTIQQGLVFESIYGKPLTKGSYGYIWRPIRAAFEASLEPRRRDELLQMEDGTYRDLDLYELRHACGSTMADRGLTKWDIAAQLGNSPAICEKTYIHVHRDRANDRIRAVLDAADVIDLDSRRRTGVDG